MVTLPAVGLYDFNNFNRAGAVEDEIFDRWREAEERKGSVGVECRRYFSQP